MIKWKLEGFDPFVDFFVGPITLEFLSYFLLGGRWYTISPEQVECMVGFESCPHANLTSTATSKAFASTRKATGPCGTKRVNLDEGIQAMMAMAEIMGCHLSHGYVSLLHDTSNGSCSGACGGNRSQLSLS